MRALNVTFALVAISSGIATPGCGPSDDLGHDESLDFETEASAKAPPDAPAPKPGELTFGRDASERVYGIHIRDQAHKQPKVIYSVRLPDLSASEQLRIRAEVALSRCNPKDVAGESGDAAVTPCDSQDMRQNPYDYAPRFSAAFELSDSPSDANGKQVSAWVDTRCTQGQHHCALAIPEVSVKDLPNAKEKYLNLVVAADADGHNAKNWHVMEVEQHKGALAVTRLGAGVNGDHAIQVSSKKLLSTGGMGVDRPEEDGDPTQVRRLMYQVELVGLAGGDIVDADARMRAYVGNYSCDPLITGELILTSDKNGWKKKGAHDERITVKNGRNCSNHTSAGCEYEKSGAVRLPQGTSSKLFASYVTVAVRSCAAASGQNQWWADKGYGSLKVNVRR